MRDGVGIYLDREFSRPTESRHGKQGIDRCWIDRAGVTRYVVS